MEIKIEDKKQANTLLKFFEDWYNEEAAYTAHENSVAKNLNKFKRLKAERPSVGTSYSDVKVTIGNKSSWIEVKMNMTDQLPSTRFFYQDGKWDSTYTTPVAKILVDLLNTHPESLKFIADLKKTLKIKNPVLLGTIAGENSDDKNVVKKDMLLKFFANRNTQNIFFIKDYDLTGLVTSHYEKGKSEPANYLQAGDNFYLIGNKNPFGLDSSIPKFKGKGSVTVRIGVRGSSPRYEMQATIKLDPKSIKISPYSILPGSKKKNPFDKYR